MKCKYCEAELPEGATVCFECGAANQMADTPIADAGVSAPAANTAPAAVASGNKCKNCGAMLPEGATVCFECGTAQNVAAQVATTGKTKSKVVAAVLAFMFGGWGIDSFYLGYMKTGIMRIVLTFVTCGVGGVIWGIVDCFRIASGTIKTDAHGNPIV